MADITALLGLPYLEGADNANGIDQGFENLANSAAAHIYNLGNAVLQEGVISGGTVTRIDANTVRVAAGSGWVQGDGVAGIGTGLFPVTWAQTDITIPNTGANKRIDRVVIPPVLDGGEATPVRVAGSEAATVDHNSLQSAASIPSGRMQIATVIASTSGISSTNDDDEGIRDRRPWARGAHTVIRREVNGSGNTSGYTTTSASYVAIDSTNLQVRIECTGNPLRLTLAGSHENSGTANTHWYAFAIANDLGALGIGASGGVEQGHRITTASDPNILHYERVVAPNAGSRLIRPNWLTTGGTAKLLADGTQELVFTVEELLNPSNNNGTS